jgi:hypothetical protein
VPFLFPAAQLPGGAYIDGAVTCNNPTRIALQEAKIFWTPEEDRNMMLSIGYGTMNNSQTHQDGPLGACRDLLKHTICSTKQHDDLAIGGHQYTRLDPALDVEPVSFDDVGAISKLQDSFRSLVAQNGAFAESLRGTAFKLLASCFYVEVEPASVVRVGSEQYSASIMIKPRITTSHLQHLYRHEHFCCLRYEIQGRSLTFTMPKKVSVRVESLRAPIEIKLKCQIGSASISGLPASVTQLLRAQSEFYHRKGSAKRRASRM